MARILLVEDNRDHLELMAYLLRSQGHVLLSAGSAESGRTMMQCCQEIDVIICDIRLGNASGIDLVRNLRKSGRLSSVPIVAVTAGSMGQAAEAFAAGFDRYILKPIEPETFVAEIEGCLAAKGSPTSAQTGRAPAAPAPFAKLPDEPRRTILAVDDIMKTHGGAITVYSEVGKGTVFQLYLPAAEEAVEESRIEKTQGDFRGNGERVLYVDDEEPLVFLMTRMLTQLGYKVTGCTEPQKALEAFRSGPYDFDVVVSDLSMPEMSGIDLAREILQTRPGMPILIASGYIRPEDNEEVGSLGLPDLLLKPDTIDELSQSLHHIFAKSKPCTDGEQSGTGSKLRHRAASST